MTYYNFIGIYDNALPNEQCQIIIDEFEDNKHQQVVGRSGGGASSAGGNGGSTGPGGRNVDGSNGNGGSAGNAIVFF